MPIADVLLSTPRHRVVRSGSPPSAVRWVGTHLKAPLPSLQPPNLPIPSPAPTECEALVVGCGVAGSATALRLAAHGIHVTMLSASADPLESATYWAQGGIIYQGKDDSPELLAADIHRAGAGICDHAALLAADIHRAGAGICDHAAVKKLTTDGPLWVERMLLSCAAVPFERDDSGELALTLEASHNRARILYKADHTGKAIQTSLIDAVRRHSRITLLPGVSVTELLVDRTDQVCCGVVALSRENNSKQVFLSGFTMLATGGLGDLYENSSNPVGARGCGLGLAIGAGAKLKNLQYVQFHPTTLFLPGERRFLLTEALRGEGAILRDHNGRAFAKDYHPDGELAPRDVVARMILSEMEKQNEQCMFLDISHKNATWIQARFPTIFEHCRAHGIDMTRQPMPVVPAAHYHCGGVEVDLHGRTSIRCLYAAGEVSCTGVHGANRLASTSLLEGLVWGCSAADDFLATRGRKPQDSAHLVPEDPIGSASPNELSDTDKKEVDAIVTAVQRVMWDSFGPLRSTQGMATGLDKLSILESRLQDLVSRCRVTHETASLRNAMRAAKAIALAAANAPESLGTHLVLA
ncbi:hypothetical protein ATCC90586_004465 [Pythium insidiosum]|nr:hypothetical protein ATCC90586_004465 [Pythium insidiosum]